MSYQIDWKSIWALSSITSSFIDSFQFLSYSVDSLVKILNKDDFKYLSQVFANNLLDQVEKKILSLRIYNWF